MLEDVEELGLAQVGEFTIKVRHIHEGAPSLIQPRKSLYAVFLGQLVGLQLLLAEHAVPDQVVEGFRDRTHGFLLRKYIFVSSIKLALPPI